MVLFWILFLIILILIIINFYNPSKRFSDINNYSKNAKLLFNRISLFTEALLFYEFSVFKADTSIIKSNSEVFNYKIYKEFQSNELKLIELQSKQDSILKELIGFEKEINTKDFFCNFLANEKGKNSSVKIEDYSNQCQQISQNLFSLGFSNAVKNLLNYVQNSNNDLLKFSNLNDNIDIIKIGNFLNDFYYIFTFIE